VMDFSLIVWLVVSEMMSLTGMDSLYIIRQRTRLRLGLGGVCIRMRLMDGAGTAGIICRR